MAEWKKIIVSGSQAELAGVTGSFTGSFFGDGSGLTGVSSFSVSNDFDNRVITATGDGNGNAEANLTFNGTLLDITGNLTVSGTSTLATNFTIAADGGTGDTFITNTARNIKIGDTAGAANNVLIDIDDPGNELKLNAGIVGISGSTVNVATSANTINLNAATINVPNIQAGTDNSVVIYDGTSLRIDEIDSRVWDTTLVDAANGVDNRLATFTDSNSLNGEANLTFDGSVLGVTGTINASSTITGSSAQLSSVPAGTDNTVLIVDNNGNVLRDEIDSRVWGSTLVDGSGLATNYVTFASDSDTITGASDFTYDGGTKLLSVTNVDIAGNLNVYGTTTEFQVTNLSIEDQFILLGSGSLDSADKGIIFDNIGGGGTGTGTAFYYDADINRLSYATAVAANATTVTPEAYIPLVFDVTGASHTPITAVGNIKIEGGEAFIYV